MAFLIVKTNNEDTNRILLDWFQGKYRPYIQDKFIRHFGNGTYLVEAHGDILALVWALKKRHDDKIDVFAADLLRDNDIPDSVKEVADHIEEKPMAKNILEDVEEVRIRCSTRSNEDL